jgi:hypothetical protein
MLVFTGEISVRRLVGSRGHSDVARDKPKAQGDQHLLLDDQSEPKKVGAKSALPCFAVVMCAEESVCAAKLKNRAKNARDSG